ncbi:hypothetical protein F5Y15DRAFT_170911 [Xylariaceae sp. FL0016]|nr:hypothetical protein F5Y15DRAFT_170911 [Xylariaceae sp. FL0016]
MVSRSEIWARGSRRSQSAHLYTWNNQGEGDARGEVHREPESSSEDDEGIAPTRPLSISPMKRPTGFEAGFHTDISTLKRSRNISDSGDKLYPGPHKKLNTGDNLGSHRASKTEENPRLPTPASINTRQTVRNTVSQDRDGSTGSNADDYPPQALLNNVNASLRQTSGSQEIGPETVAQDAAKQCHGLLGEALHHFKNAHSYNGSENLAAADDGHHVLQDTLQSRSPSTSPVLGSQDELQAARLVSNDNRDDQDPADSIPPLDLDLAPPRRNDVQGNSHQFDFSSEIDDPYEPPSSPPQRNQIPKAQTSLRRTRPLTGKGRQRVVEYHGSSENISKITSGDSKGKVTGQDHDCLPHGDGSIRDYSIQVARLWSQSIPTPATEDTPRPLGFARHASIGAGNNDNNSAEPDTDGSPPPMENVLPGLRPRNRVNHVVRSHHRPAADSRSNVNAKNSAELIPHHPQRYAEITGLPGNNNEIEIHDSDAAENHDERGYINEELSEDKYDIHDIGDTESDGGFEDDLPAGASFEKDVEFFQAHYFPSPIDAEIFQPPNAEDDLAVHISHEQLRNTCKYMGRKHWLGLKENWHLHSFSIDEEVQTKPGRKFASMLTRLERLLHEVPQAPLLLDQNKFLGTYSDILGYYLLRIGRLINHIRKKHLAKLGSGGSHVNQAHRKRKAMSDELISCIIPKLVHVLARVWSLGGNVWSESLFTNTVIGLLRRLVRWIMLLQGLLVEDLKRRQHIADDNDSLGAGEPLSSHKEELELIQQFGTLMQVVYDTVEGAPNKLAAEERNRRRVAKERQRNLRRQEEAEAKLRRTKIAQRREIEKRQQRSLRSLQSYARAFSRTSTPHTLPSSSKPSPSPSPWPRCSQWTQEEKKWLIKKIQDSYPEIPKLRDFEWELDKSLEELEAMTEKLLDVMLEAVEPLKTSDERAADLRAMMRRYRRSR